MQPNLSWRFADRNGVFSDELRATSRLFEHDETGAAMEYTVAPYIVHPHGDEWRATINDVQIHVGTLLGCLGACEESETL